MTIGLRVTPAEAAAIYQQLLITHGVTEVVRMNTSITLHCLDHQVPVILAWLTLLLIEHKVISFFVYKEVTID